MSHPEVTASSTQPVPKVIELPGAPPFREWHMNSNNIVRKSVEIYGERQGIKGRGAYTAFARACNVSRQTVWHWCRHNSVPLKYADFVSDITGLSATSLNSEMRNALQKQLGITGTGR